MRKMYFRIGTGILLAGWMAVIFYFSSQPAVESDQVSGSASYLIVSTADQIFHLGQTPDELLKKAMRINYPIRKAAHMTEYAIMGLLSFAFYHNMGVEGKRRYAAAFLTTAAYAATDEFHQLFVPGRSGMISDVCIDTAGAALGLALLFVISICIQGLIRKK